MGNMRTWSSRGALVHWNYRPVARREGQLVRLDLEEPETRKRWLCDLLSRLPALLGDFGYIAEVSASKRRVGERACVIDWREKAGPSALLSFVQQGEIDGVDADLNLTCLDSALAPMEIPSGASFVVNIRLTESGDLDPKTDAPVYLHFVLHADIYAPWADRGT